MRKDALRVGRILQLKVEVGSTISRSVIDAHQRGKTARTATMFFETAA